VAKKRKTPRDFFEPWVTTKSKTHGSEPDVNGFPEEAAAGVLDALFRVDKNADWIIWGSRMREPCIVKGYPSGEVQVMDDRRIIAVRRFLGLDDSAPDNEAVAKRICDCVNACKGIGNPEEFVTDARALLLAMVQGDTMDVREDVRVISLLARCLPPEELELVSNAHEY